MSDDKPINAMYGGKIKLDLDKLKKKSSNSEEKIVETIVEKPVETKQEVEETIEEPVSEVADEPEVVEEVVEETIEEPVSEVADEPEVVEEVVEETAQELKEKPKTSKKTDSKKLDDLKNKLNEKDNKLSNQSNELNYLTNKVIPKLKNENAELRGLKEELTRALEKTSRKYFDQLDINADLSNTIGKIGAEGAVHKVRADKLESQIDSIKEDLEGKIKELKDKLSITDIDVIKNENDRLTNEVKQLKEKLSDARKENISLSDDVDELRAQIIEFGNYKDEVDAKSKKEIDSYKEKISNLKTQLKLKESSYDKLSNESGKTISDLRKQIAKLEQSLEKQSNKGLFNRFK